MTDYIKNENGIQLCTFCLRGPKFGVVQLVKHLKARGGRGPLPKTAPATKSSFYFFSPFAASKLYKCIYIKIELHIAILNEATACQNPHTVL